MPEVVVALVAALVPATAASAASAAVDPCAAGSNPIVCENSKPGADPAEWDLSGGAGDPSIQGFATDISVDAGQRINFKIDTSATSYTIDIYRTGWYGGKGARKWASVTHDAPLPQPECAVDLETGLYDCGSWAVTAHWDVPADAVSGVYVARLTRTDEGPDGGASHITFVVRNDTSHSDLVFQTSDTTWQAYNTYGGADFYQGTSNGRAFKISYNRPFATRGSDNGRSFYFSSEYAMVRFLEQNGYDVSYISGVDTARSGSLLLNHRTFLSVGHDEYWSGQQRANVEAARDAGVNLAFFSGNEMYWRTRWEDSVAGDPAGYRTLVCYKETWSNAKVDPSAEWTGTWRDPRLAGAKDGGGLPENAVTGTIYMANDSDLPVTVTLEEGRLRLWRETDLASMPAGASQALAAHTVGYESDEDLDNGARPAGLVRLSTTSGDVPHYLRDFGNTDPPGRTTHHVTLYRADSGALVFSAGSVQWAWGLDQTHDGAGAPADPRMRQATMNLLADMGAQPVTPASGLVVTTASTDHTGPAVTVTSPKPGAEVANGSLLTVSGTATDSGGAVAGVEVSLDGGASWHPADGRASWSFTGLQHGVGTTEVQVRATDDSANIGPVATVGVDVSCPCSVFGSAVPALASVDDTSAVELGLRFEPQVDGVVEGVRFYKGAANAGTHTGSLWSDTGQLLARVELTDETSTGWQDARFQRPVPVEAGQSYTVSYTAPRGGYANEAAAFASGSLDAAPLTVEGGFGAKPSGVFGSPGTFPQQSFSNAAYFVDVLFDLPGGAPLTASGQAPEPGAASVPPDSVVSATLSTNVDPQSVAVTLVDAAGGTVAGTTRYDAASGSVTFTPSAPLAGFVEYTVKVTATTADGHALGDGSTWTFRSARPTSSACPCGIFDDAVLPMIPSAADPLPVTLGMRFRASSAGQVVGVRFYKTSASTGPFTVQLWGPGAEQLAQATVTNAVSSGWQETPFEAPVQVTAGTTYTASYRTESGHYAATPGGLADPMTRGELSTPESAGTYAYGGGAPETVVSTNYLVDVEYVPDASVASLTDGGAGRPGTAFAASQGWFVVGALRFCAPARDRLFGRQASASTKVTAGWLCQR
ncbi:N,N-dimethylformamidase beta subunit family domain-containing protein [Xylanimonas sp. McL0601]|uniref:N,N-dimethylformamidase beta subunit family domain-containing protein n=1 Tax=Xylanimonas sp. McL0601 TaxID=3414739 RepID=UPI003CEAA5DD